MARSLFVLFPGAEGATLRDLFRIKWGSHELPKEAEVGREGNALKSLVIMLLMIVILKLQSGGQV